MTAGSRRRAAVQRLRALALPVLLLAVGSYALHTASEPSPAPTAALEPVPPEEPLAELWDAWGPDLTGQDDPDYPVLLAALDRDEALYVLLTVRAAQVAAAVDRAGPPVDVDEALEQAGLSSQPALVPATRVPGRPDCVLLTLEDEPYGRSYFGWADAPSEPGPSPLSPLEKHLLRTARVGLDSLDAETCGGAVAYSPTAQEALRQLSPELLG